MRKYEHKKEAVRALRKTYLDEKKKAMDKRDEVIQQAEKAEKDGDDKRNDLKSGNLFSMDNYNQNDGYSAMDTNALKQKLNDYEEAFRRINEATGVSDVNEIIQKFTTQDETSKSLSDLKQEYIDKIEVLTQEKYIIKEQLDDLKYSGGENMNRK